MSVSSDDEFYDALETIPEEYENETEKISQESSHTQERPISQTLTEETNNSITGEDDELLNTILKDIPDGHDVATSELENESPNNSIDPLSLTIIKRAGTTAPSHKKEKQRKDPLETIKKNRMNLFQTKDLLESVSEIGTEPTIQDAEQAIQYLKVKSRKKVKQFDKLFLAQEVQTRTTCSNANSIWALKFSKDGKYLAAGGQNCLVEIFRVFQDQIYREGYKILESVPFRVYSGHQGDILDLSWSNNHLLLSASMDKTVRLWHISKEQCLCCFQHSDFVTSISFHPLNDRYFLSGSLDKRIRLWNIPERKVEHFNEVSNLDLITAVAFTANGKFALAGTHSGVCTLFETEEMKFSGELTVPTKDRYQLYKVTSIQHLSSNDDNLQKVIISYNDSRIRLFQITSNERKVITKFKGHVNHGSQIRAHISDDQKFIISGSEDKCIYIWNVDQMEEGSQSTFWPKKESKPGYEYFRGHSHPVTVATFAPQAIKKCLLQNGDYIFNTTANNHHLANLGDIIVSSDRTGVIKVFRQDTRDISYSSNSLTKSLLMAARTSGRNEHNLTKETYHLPLSPNSPIQRNKSLSAPNTPLRKRINLFPSVPNFHKDQSSPSTAPSNSSDHPPSNDRTPEPKSSQSYRDRRKSFGHKFRTLSQSASQKLKLDFHRRRNFSLTSPDLLEVTHT